MNSKVGAARFVLPAVLLAAVAALGGAVVSSWLRADGFTLQAGTWLPTSRAVAPFTLTAQDGRPFTDAQLQGAPTLVFFGFTHCPDICPTTLALLAQLRRAAPVPADLRTVLVSLDPQRDDPAALQRYLGAFDAQFIGLTGAPSQIDGVARNLGVAHMRRDLPGGDYMIDHSATLFLLDRQARLVAVFSQPISLAALQADLRSAASRLN